MARGDVAVLWDIRVWPGEWSAGIASALFRVARGLGWCPRLPARLLERPRDRKALAPLFKREILWRLMTGEQGDVVRQLGLADNPAAGGAVFLEVPERAMEFRDSHHDAGGG